MVLIGFSGFVQLVHSEDWHRHGRRRRGRVSAVRLDRDGRRSSSMFLRVHRFRFNRFDGYVFLSLFIIPYDQTIKWLFRPARSNTVWPRRFSDTTALVISRTVCCRKQAKRRKTRNGRSRWRSSWRCSSSRWRTRAWRRCWPWWSRTTPWYGATVITVVDDCKKKSR